MNEQLGILIENYRDGVPVKIERKSVMMLSVVAIVTVAVCAFIVKYVKKL